MNRQGVLDLDSGETSKDSPVTCLGMTFPNDEERRKYFLGILREKLKDPEFRKIEGFPIGSDEDILALSDPPYYTACPNPFIADFIKEWEREKKTEAVKQWLASKCVGQAFQPAPQRETARQAGGLALCG